MELPKFKKRVWFIAGALVIIIAGGFWYSKNKGNENLQKEVATRNSLKRTIPITGSLVSESPIALNFENSGRVQTIKYKVGDKVIEGDIIAVLDNNVLSEQVKKAKAALDAARMTARMNDDTAREALESVDNAKDYLDAIEEYHDQVVDAAEIAYQNKSQYADDAEDYYNQIVSDSGAGSAEAKSAKLTLTAAQNAEEEAEEAWSTAKKNRDLYIVSAENSVDTAEENLETVESDYAELSRDASVRAAEADYQIALESLSNASLKAPLNGVLSKVNYEVGEVLGSASLTSSFGEMITNDFILEADVPESDVSEIKLGQMAEVTFDAFNFEDKFKAEVIEIEPASTVIQDVIYYKAKLKIKNPSSFQFKEGMSADIDVLVDSKDNAVQVSDQFIYEREDGTKFVKVMEKDVLIERTVELGLDGDGGYTEILSGLKEGEEVYSEEE